PAPRPRVRGRRGTAPPPVRRPGRPRPGTRPRRTPGARRAGAVRPVVSRGEAAWKRGGRDSPVGGAESPIRPPSGRRCAHPGPARPWQVAGGGPGYGGAARRSPRRAARTHQPRSGRVPIHLFIVHFPVALVLVGAAVDLVGVATASPPTRRWGGILVMLGAVAALLAFWTGQG